MVEEEEAEKEEEEEKKEEEEERDSLTKVSEKSLERRSRG